VKGFRESQVGEKEKATFKHNKKFTKDEGSFKFPDKADLNRNKNQTDIKLLNSYRKNKSNIVFTKY
jgi:hypothetical protein